MECPFHNAYLEDTFLHLLSTLRFIDRDRIPDTEPMKTVEYSIYTTKQTCYSKHQTQIFMSYILFNNIYKSVKTKS